MRIRHLIPALAVGLCFTMVACSGGGKKADGSGSGSGDGNQAGGGKNGYVGAFDSSGLYAAKWSAAPDVEANPFNSYGALTLLSDKQNYGNIHVDPDGSLSFGSADPAFGNNLTFKGGGAKVTLDKSGKFVCAFTVDTDLKSTRDDAATLHVKGGLTVHWHP
jgi:hypothetical protein